MTIFESSGILWALYEGRLILSSDEFQIRLKKIQKKSEFDLKFEFKFDRI